MEQHSTLYIVDLSFLNTSILLRCLSLGGQKQKPTDFGAKSLKSLEAPTFVGLDRKAPDRGKSPQPW